MIGITALAQVEKFSCLGLHSLFICHETKIVEKGKALNFQAVNIPILTYGHESWVMTKRVALQMQAAKMRSL